MIARGNKVVFTVLDNFTMHQRDFTTSTSFCLFRTISSSIVKFRNGSRERCKVTESHKNRKFDYNLGDMTCIR